MRLLVSIAQIPFVLWILLAAGLAYMDYREWDESVYQTLVADRASKTSELARMVAANKRAQEFDAQRAAKLKELQDLGEQFKETAAKIPRTASVSALLKSFADVSDSIGVDIVSYKPMDETSDAFVQITPLEVTVVGSYPEVMSFLDAVANLERIVHSKHVTFANAKQSGGTSRVTSKILFETYSISQVAIDTESQGTSTKAPNTGQAHGSEVAPNNSEGGSE